VGYVATTVARAPRAVRCGNGLVGSNLYLTVILHRGRGRRVFASFFDAIYSATQLAGAASVTKRELMSMCNARSRRKVRTNYTARIDTHALSRWLSYFKFISQLIRNRYFNCQIHL